jgi:2,3-bisphosphoglycerate-dependent phosphoglycerate mutase
MTSVFFVRHAQSDYKWEDDRTRPLTALGMGDAPKVTEVLKDYRIDAFYCSPYKRSLDTVADCAKSRGMKIKADERLRERVKGINGHGYLEERWSDLDFHEENGESVNMVKKRNIEAINEILKNHPGQNILIGTHGTALCAILNHFDKNIGLAAFSRIIH